MYLSSTGTSATTGGLCSVKQMGPLSCHPTLTSSSQLMAPTADPVISTQSGSSSNFLKSHFDWNSDSALTVG